MSMFPTKLVPLKGSNPVFIIMGPGTYKFDPNIIVKRRNK